MLRDMSGKLVYQEKVSLQNGSSIVKLDIDYLKNGLYFVSVHADRAIKTRKLIIQ
jgi:hypothetical protein